MDERKKKEMDTEVVAREDTSKAVVVAAAANTQPVRHKNHKDKRNKSLMLRHPAIKRASLRAGILRMSEKVYDIVFESTEKFIHKIMKDALIYKGANRKTVSSKHIRAACLKNGERVLDSFNK